METYKITERIPMRGQVVRILVSFGDNKNIVCDATCDGVDWCALCGGVFKRDTIVEWWPKYGDKQRDQRRRRRSCGMICGCRST